MRSAETSPGNLQKKEMTQGLRVLIMLAPIIFVAHFLEESPGFVQWFNAHVPKGITAGLFWNVNISALVITLIVMLSELVIPSVLSACIVILWLSFLMLANALFHITGAVVDGRYMPGLITAIILYLPYYSVLVLRLVKKHRLTIPAVIILALSGSALMLIHGYLIIFRGSRLF